MILVENYVHTFKPPIGVESRCEVVIYSHNGTDIILFKNIDESGISVTNATEQLATEVVKRHELDPRNCRFFETYSYLGEESEYDEVTYKWNSDNVANIPTWKPQMTIDFEIIEGFIK